MVLEGSNHAFEVRINDLESEEVPKYGASLFVLGVRIGCHVGLYVGVRSRGGVHRPGGGPHPVPPLGRVPSTEAANHNCDVRAAERPTADEYVVTSYNTTHSQ